MDIKQVLKIASKVVSIASAVIGLGLTIANNTKNK